MQGFPPPRDLRVTRSTALLTPPYNRWAYLNMRLLYPSAPVRAAAEPIALERRIDDLDGVAVPRPDGNGTAGLGDYLRETYGDALVVVHEGRVIHERYANGMHADHPHQMMSVTKSFCGLLALLAIEDGRMDESDAVVAHVPELADSSAFADATVGQVLDMTNSMAFTEDYADPLSGIRRYGAVLGWTDPVPGIRYEDNLPDYLATLERDDAEPHGRTFHYQTPKTDVLNWITNRVEGRSFRETLHDRLWSRLGTDGETYVLLDRNATLVAGGGLNATPENLARFAAMMTADGVFAGEQVVPSGVIRKIAAGGDIAAFDRGPDSDDVVHRRGEWSYRAQWWVRHTPGREAFMAIGINGQWIHLDPARRIAIVKQSSQPVSKDEYLNGFDLNAFDAIAAHVSSR
ncbi:serine hydrolase [Agromyces sp. Q22]|uniref:Serine hydrolase n=2 Tax=Agromyces kandeliae TaxID=2666141 RepID=A0A6L5R4P7_9MICO|nr:serine hydrolase [Agromyces kandeliae]